MTVNEFNKTLTQLVELLKITKSNQQTINGLEEFIESTATFGDLTLKAFVKLAETGRTPKLTTTPQTRNTSKQTVDATAIVIEIKNLYDHAGESTVTEEQIKSESNRLNSLKKPELVKLADSIELSGMKSKKIGEIISGITNRILDRKGAAVRRQLIDRPQGNYATNPTGVT
jgi:hypothetical protein